MRKEDRTAYRQGQRKFYRGGELIVCFEGKGERVGPRIQEDPVQKKKGISPALGSSTTAKGDTKCLYVIS